MGVGQNTVTQENPKLDYYYLITLPTGAELTFVKQATPSLGQSIDQAIQFGFKLEDIKISLLSTEQTEQWVARKKAKEGK